MIALLDLFSIWSSSKEVAAHTFESMLYVFSISKISNSCIQSSAECIPSGSMLCMSNIFLHHYSLQFSRLHRMPLKFNILAISKVVIYTPIATQHLRLFVGQ